MQHQQLHSEELGLRVAAHVEFLEHVHAYGGTGSTFTGPGPPIHMQHTSSGALDDGCNLFVFYVPNEMTNLDLYRIFGAFGSVLSAHIMVEKASGRSRGFAFVNFAYAANAANAIIHINGMQAGSKRLKVQHKRERSATPATTGGFSEFGYDQLHPQPPPQTQVWTESETNM